MCLSWRSHVAQCLTAEGVVPILGMLTFLDLATGDGDSMETYRV